ncbi:hypothetical protein Tco_1341226, partial [Tanacetum coccineum]
MILDTQGMDLFIKLLLKGASGLHVLTNSRDILEGLSVVYAETLEKDLADLCSKGIYDDVGSGQRCNL